MVNKGFKDATECLVPIDHVAKCTHTHVTCVHGHNIIPRFLVISIQFVCGIFSGGENTDKEMHQTN